MIRNSKGKIEH